jgi:hypothetical protein
MKRQGKATRAMMKERRLVKETDTSPPAREKINTTHEIKITVQNKLKFIVVENTIAAALR